MNEETALSESETASKQHTPWIELLYAPRQAFNYILKRNPYTDIQFWFLFPVCSLAITVPYWMITAPQSIKAYNLGHQEPIALGFLLVVMFVFNVNFLAIITLIFGSVAKWVGGLMGGKSSFRKLYSVLMWANLPYVYMLVVNRLLNFSILPTLGKMGYWDTFFSYGWYY
jgi:hypothetical protein